MLNNTDFMTMKLVSHLIIFMVYVHRCKFFFLLAYEILPFCNGIAVCSRRLVQIPAAEIQRYVLLCPEVHVRLCTG